MKSHLLFGTLITLLLLSGTIYAQPVTVGIKGGFSIPDLSAGANQNPINSGYSSRFGPDFSVYGEYHVSKIFSFSLGVEYSSQGGKKNKFQAYTTPSELASIVTTPYLYADFKSEAKFNYLLVPVLARYYRELNYSGSTKFYVAVGPFAGFLLNAHQVTSGSSVIYLDAGKTMPLSPDPQSFDDNSNIKSDLYHFNLGVDGFLGISHDLSRRHTIFIEVGGNYGFLSIQKNAENGKNYTGAGVMTIGYAYSIRRK
ncbi:MAG: porin family protein [Bacteroidota bacterium]|nr:porin family protein [Bacteroidota bacterium]